MRTIALLFVTLTTTLVLTGCTHDPVAANIALQSPDPYLFVRFFGAPILALLAIVAGLAAAVVMLMTLQAARAERLVRRWPIVVTVLLQAVLIVTAGVLLFTYLPALTFQAFSSVP